MPAVEATWGDVLRSVASPSHPSLPHISPHPSGVVWAERKGTSFFNPQEVQAPFRHVADLEV